jgi:hypothetical protein
MHRNTEIDVGDPVPLLFREIGSRHDRLFDTGVVEGEVEAPEGLDRTVQRRLHVRGPRHVAPDRERPPAGLFDHAGRFPVALFRNIGDHHVGALARERQRRGAADAAPRSGHKRDLSCEASILCCHLLLLLAGK